MASAGSPAWVYALGKVEVRFPNLSLEKEYYQIVGREETKGLTDTQASHAVLSQRQNRYLARQLCWVLTIEGLETYILHARDSDDVDLLVETLKPVKRPTDVDLIIGQRGPIAPATMCNGLMVPIVAVDQTYSFDVNTLIKSIPKPEKVAAKEFEAAAEDIFYRIMQMADNAGATDDHRALNYLAVRYPAIYHRAAECFGEKCSLSSVEVRPSRLSGARKIVDVIFTYTHRDTDVIDKYFVRVDVSEEFPFLVTKLSPYYDR